MTILSTFPLGITPTPFSTVQVKGIPGLSTKSGS